MLIEFSYNDKVVLSGFLKSKAYEISKFIDNNPGGSYSLKYLKKLKTKTKVVREITNACDITERCLLSLL